MSNKRRITVELTEKDQEHVRVIQAETGDTTAIAAIRFALREAAQHIVFAEIARKIDSATGRQE